jgi:hypothetical protein
MSTAILISGQLRTFAQCYPTQRWHVLRHFTDCHFFITVQAQPDAHEILAPLIADYGADRVHLQQLTDPDLSAHLTPKLARAYHQAPYTNAAPAHQLLLQHWYQAQVYSHFIASTDHLPFFSTVIRLRPDLFFHSFAPAYFDVDDLLADEVLTPWWGRFGGLNDRFAIMGDSAAPAYFDVFDKIAGLLAAGCPFHPETLLKARLDYNHDLRVSDRLRAEFSTLRPGGQMRPAEITPIDLAHAALSV